LKKEAKKPKTGEYKGSDTSIQQKKVGRGGLVKNSQRQSRIQKPLQEKKTYAGRGGLHWTHKRKKTGPRKKR